MTANRREAMAAAEMRASETIRNSDEVFATVAGEISEGSEYAFVAIATNLRDRYRRTSKSKERGGWKDASGGDHREARSRGHVAVGRALTSPRANSCYFWTPPQLQRRR